jgi:hypothetical protein
VVVVEEYRDLETQWLWVNQAGEAAWGKCNRSWRPVGLSDVEGLKTNGLQMAEKLRFLAGRPLTLGRFLVLISVRGWIDPRVTERLQGLGQLGNPITSSEIEPANFRPASWWGWDWVHLAPLFGLLPQQRMMDDECGAVGEMSGRGNRSIRRKPAPVPRCPPQILHDVTWAQTRAAAVGSRQATDRLTYGTAFVSVSQATELLRARSITKN